MRKDKSTLHLVLKHVWYNMFQEGIKKDEYRDIGKWARKICLYGGKECNTACKDCPKYKENNQIPTELTNLVIHKGYTSTTLQKPIVKITVGRGNPDWGAPVDSDVVRIETV